MKVLVTGGSGIVGHYVIDELYKLGHEVINADKFRMTSNSVIVVLRDSLLVLIPLSKCEKLGTDSYIFLS
ncbi:MAG: hypothetical protein CM1200mP39_30260 [Dehalococcoidia bacterium]|nr:MAG: hypothetical protein CM1200mP39_30260 [Dehalococcoidia bacterium]